MLRPSTLVFNLQHSIFSRSYRDNLVMWSRKPYFKNSYIISIIFQMNKISIRNNSQLAQSLPNYRAIKVLTPNKFTYLESNQLLGSIRRSPLSFSTAVLEYCEETTAYENCEREKQRRLEIEKRKHLQKISVQKLIVSNCKSYEIKKTNRLEDMRREYVQIEMLKHEMQQKAKRIMSLEEPKKYVRKNLEQLGLSTIKSIPEKNSKIKIEINANLRQYMKEKTNLIKNVEIKKQQQISFNNSFNDSLGLNQSSESIVNQTSFGSSKHINFSQPINNTTLMKSIAIWPKTQKQLKQELRRNLSRQCFIKEQTYLSRQEIPSNNIKLKKSPISLLMTYVEKPRKKKKIKQASIKEQEQRILKNFTNRIQELESTKHFAKEFANVMAMGSD